jgi:hypothetical protein
MKVAPKSVSGLVVKTRTPFALWEIASEAPPPRNDCWGALPRNDCSKTISAPSERPNQLRCAKVVLSDQSIFDLSSRFASNRSA